HAGLPRRSRRGRPLSRNPPRPYPRRLRPRPHDEPHRSPLPRGPRHPPPRAGRPCNAIFILHPLAFASSRQARQPMFHLDPKQAVLEHVAQPTAPAALNDLAAMVADQPHERTYSATVTTGVAQAAEIALLTGTGL